MEERHAADDDQSSTSSKRRKRRDPHEEFYNEMGSVKLLTKKTENGEKVVLPNPPEDAYALLPCMYPNPQHLKMELHGTEQNPILDATPNEAMLDTLIYGTKWTHCCGQSSRKPSGR